MQPTARSINAPARPFRSVAETPWHLHTDDPEQGRRIRCFVMPGHMTGKSADRWLQDLWNQVERRPADCVLDIAGTHHLDAHGFRILLEAAERVRHIGRRVVLVEPHDRIRALLEDLCLHREISVFDDLSSALSYLAESAPPSRDATLYRAAS